MKELQVFENAQFGKVRTVEENGKVYFCGKDIASALGYANSKKALTDHCKEHGVTKRYLIDSIGRQQQAKFIDEGNLYRLITHSKLPEAEKFESWVFDEVLPKIRRTGEYKQGGGSSLQYKEQMLEVRRQNARIRTAQLLYKVAKDCPVTTYKQVLQSHITELLTGQRLLPLPPAAKRTYKAGEIGKMLGISAMKVGTLTNRYNLKTAEYGEWVWTKSVSSAHECQSFEYYITVVERLRAILEGGVA